MGDAFLKLDVLITVVNNSRNKRQTFASLCFINRFVNDQLDFFLSGPQKPSDSTKAARVADQANAS